MTDTRVSEEREAAQAEFQQWWDDNYHQFGTRLQAARGAWQARAERETPPTGNTTYSCGHTLHDADAPQDCNWKAEVPCPNCERETQGGEMRRWIKAVYEDLKFRCHSSTGPSMCKQCVFVAEAERILSQTGEKATTKPKGDRND